MPELPEVETIRRSLNATVVGKRIARAVVQTHKMVSIGPATVSQYRRGSLAVARRVQRILRGARVLTARRRAKLLVLSLSNGWTITIHLKMSGQLLYRKRLYAVRSLSSKHTHLRVEFSDGSALCYNDPRMFGYVRLVRNDEMDNVPELHAYGPEPLSVRFTPMRLQQIVQRLPKAPLKRILIDQSRIAGIGNIYADEACFAARILPTRRAQSLSIEECHSLYRGIRRVLRTGIRHGGSSVTCYVRLDGSEGHMVQHLAVYGREGMNCIRCRGVVRKIRFLGRGTYFCLACQV